MSKGREVQLHVRDADGLRSWREAQGRATLARSARLGDPGAKRKAGRPWREALGMGVVGGEEMYYKMTF